MHSQATYYGVRIMHILTLINKNYGSSPKHIRDAFKKKIAEKETLVHSHLTPSLPSLNGTRGMKT